MDVMGNCTMAAGGVVHSMWGRAIKEPIDALEDTGVDTAWVDSGINVNSAIAAGSIKDLLSRTTPLTL